MLLTMYRVSVTFYHKTLKTLKTEMTCIPKSEWFNFHRVRDSWQNDTLSTGKYCSSSHIPSISTFMVPHLFVKNSQESVVIAKCLSCQDICVNFHRATIAHAAQKRLVGKDILAPLINRKKKVSIPISSYLTFSLYLPFLINVIMCWQNLVKLRKLKSREIKPRDNNSPKCKSHWTFSVATKVVLRKDSLLCLP